MKTFSVAFYKKLFLTLLALLILAPSVCAIALKIQNSQLCRQLAEMEGAGDSSQNDAVVALVAEPIDYQTLYPELYSTAEISADRGYESGTIYLTFNSTPSQNTTAILDILDDYGIKATFFLSPSADSQAEEQMRSIVNRGHSVGLNGYSDSYQQIYSSVTAFLEDFKTAYDTLYEATGIRAEIFRYPGGSINPYNVGFYEELNAEMLRRGFVFFDWDVSGEDTLMVETDADHIRESVVSGMAGKGRGIVLLRDAEGRKAVAEALPGIISELRSQGYSFQPLTANVIPVIYSYKGAS